MSKYVIELRPDCKVVQEICESDGQVSIGAKSSEYLEELNSDYINEHFGELQDDAYQRGLEEGKKATWGLVADASNAEYQRGLDDAWDAARKIVEMSDPPYWEVFDEYKNDLFGKITASEAIEKLKAYEEKQKADDEIKVGDEVNWGGDCFIVTRIFQPRNMKEQCDGIDNDGCVYHDVLMDDLEKTGRHSDIMKILEEVQT